MRFSSRFFTARVVSREMSPHKVAGSLTSRHRSRRVKSVSGRTLAMGCISLLRLDGLSFGVGYALLFAGPFYTIHRTLPTFWPGSASTVRMVYWEQLNSLRWGSSVEPG